MKLHGYQDARCTSLDGFAAYVKDGNADAMDTLLVRRHDEMHGYLLCGGVLDGLRIKGKALDKLALGVKVKYG